MTGTRNDVLEGRGGADELAGDAGADLLDVRDGGPDVAGCGTETDAVIADLPGIDALTACGNIAFPLASRASGAAIGAGDGSGRTTGPAATRPPSLLVDAAGHASNPAREKLEVLERRSGPRSLASRGSA